MKDTQDPFLYHVRNSWKLFLYSFLINKKFDWYIGDGKEFAKKSPGSMSGGHPSPSPMSPGPGGRPQLRRESALNLEDGLNDENHGVQI